MIFTFNRGSWEDGSPLSEWEEEDGEDFEDYLIRIGYHGNKTIFGHEDNSHFEIHETMDGGSFYCIATPLRSNSYDVFLPDFPSLMMFIRDYGTAFSVGNNEGTGAKYAE